jgi:hypothetical protein
MRKPNVRNPLVENKELLKQKKDLLVLGGWDEKILKTHYHN